MTNPMPCRVVVAYRTGLLGHGLQSLLEHAGAFEVVAALAEGEDLARAIREYPPRCHIESGVLSSENAQAVLNTALAHPNMSVLSISLERAQPTMWRTVSVVAEGRETVVEALWGHLSVPAGGGKR